MWTLFLCALWIPIGAWIGQEIDGLVYTVEEVDLLRLEKHISVWRVDLEESRGGNRKLEVLLAQRLIRESSLLMRSLRAYAGTSVPPERAEVQPMPERKKMVAPQERKKCLPPPLEVWEKRMEGELGRISGPGLELKLRRTA